jgi:hypothetical protein
MVLNALAGLALAGVLYVPALMLTRRGSFAFTGSAISLLLPAGMALSAVVAIVSWSRAGRAFWGRSLGPGAGGERTSVLPLSPTAAFDTVLGALAWVPGARVDVSSTSVEAGTLSATTRWRWLLGDGERLDVRLYPLDGEHVLVSASCYPIHRGTWGDHRRDERNVARLFAAFPAGERSDAADASL